MRKIRGKWALIAVLILFVTGLIVAYIQQEKIDNFVQGIIKSIKHEDSKDKFDSNFSINISSYNDDNYIKVDGGGGGGGGGGGESTGGFGSIQGKFKSGAPDVGQIYPKYYCTPQSREADCSSEVQNEVCGWYDPVETICGSDLCVKGYVNQCNSCLNEEVVYWTQGECPLHDYNV